MTDEPDQRAIKGCLGTVALVVVSGFFAYDEFSYLAWGQTVDATVTKAYEQTGRRGGRSLVVDFTFTEPGGQFRRGTDTVSPDWPLPRTGTVAVEYTPGELGRARLKGHTYSTATTLFLVAVAAAVGWGLFLWWEGYKATREDAPRKRRKRRRPAV